MQGKRTFLALAAVFLMVALTSTSWAYTGPRNVERAMQSPRTAGIAEDLPARAPEGFARADTIDFGYYTVIGGQYYAVQGEVWTWDHGAPNPYEGWYSIDMTANTGTYFRHITQAIWSSDDANPPQAPVIDGIGSVWIGMFESEAQELCWDAGLGYGNTWCQWLVSPVHTYDGIGLVSLDMDYWCDSEPNFDYTRVLLRVPPNQTPLNGYGFHGKIGFSEGSEFPDDPQTYARDISNADFGGGSSPVNFQIVLEFNADNLASDQDGDYPTTYGPFGADNISLTNNLVGGDVVYDFEDGLQGWTTMACPGAGSYFGIADLSNYVIQDPCVCELSGNVVELHDAYNQHPGTPNGQFERMMGPIIDRTQVPNYNDYNQIMGEYDIYAEMPEPNGVFYRAGWSYYPYICPSTGEEMWSPRVGIDTWYYTGDQPICFSETNVGTDWGLPPDCEQVRFIFEISSSCDDFGIPETVCTGVTNFTPVLDNVRVRMTGVPNAPVVNFDSGTYYQDGFGQGLLLSTTDVGNADVVYDLHRDDPTPDLLGDSLYVKGPVAMPSSRWQARLWFRVKREGPGQNSIPLYNAWTSHAGVNKGYDFTGGDFTYAWMDSIEVGTNVAKNKFCSQFHESDPGYLWGGGGEQGEGNEIIPDGALTAGTKIEYFVTASYICTPDINYYLPDTAGAFYREFEILPSYRNVEGVDKFPAVLYVDAYNNGAQFYIENALNTVLHNAGPGDPIPDPAKWDRYDYLDASSNWNAPLFRNLGGNAGATLPQLLGYRLIMVNTGNYSQGCMEPRDWAGFGDWIAAVACDANSETQGFIANGNNVSLIISEQRPSFLSQYLGTIHECDIYYESGCPQTEIENDENYCVRLEPGAGAGWFPGVPLDVFGNWCPPQLTYDVMTVTNGGFGNKIYEKVDSGAPAEYAQIIRDGSADPNNYRAVIDGYSYHYMSKRDMGNLGPDTECPIDSASRVEASLSEISEQIKWTLGISDPFDLGLRVDPCSSGQSGVDGAEDPGSIGVTRLYQNRPNPFNPRTTIRFSLAQTCPAKLIIYDVNGRQVKTLLDGVTEGGSHEVVWDGTDDSGRPVASGVFWSQLSTQDFSSNRKMVVLK